MADQDYPVTLREGTVTEEGLERFSGVLRGDLGGSQPGQLLTKDFMVTEEATPGEYQFVFPVPAKTTILDVVYFTLDTWAADNVAIQGDDQMSGANAYWHWGFDGGPTNIGADQWDPLNATGGYGYNYVGDEAEINLYYKACGFGGLNQASLNAGVYYEAADEITITVVTTIDTPPVVPTGRILVRIIYFTAIDPEPVGLA